MGKTHDPDKLTDMQAAFVAHYLVTLNATKSAILAGYSKDSAGEQGYQLLRNPSVSKALRKAMARRAKRLGLTAENVLREIARIAFSDIRAVAEFDTGGVKVRSSKDLHPDAAAAIHSVTESTSISRDGANTTIKVRMHDKLKALDLAGRHLGLWDLPEGDDEKDRSLTLNYSKKTKEPA